MIGQVEIKKLAAKLGVDPRIVDHDYALGCFLHFLALQNDVQTSWLFKGGTALAKCYFRGYRFSEDLDFTLRSPVKRIMVGQIIEKSKVDMQKTVGIRADSRETIVEIVQDEYGQEAFEVRVYYFGPLDLGGSPRSIKIHLNADEEVVFPNKVLPIIHEYSDRTELPQVMMPVYSLEEMLVEKLRALSGQRRFAIARDVFDIHFLRHKADFQAALRMFARKCGVKGMSPGEIDLPGILQRKEDYRTNWTRNLEFLIPPQMQVGFETAWAESIKLLRQALSIPSA